MSDEAMPRAEVGATTAAVVGASKASSTAASPSTSAAALCTQQQSASPVPAQSSSAHSLHKDALHCVLAFLSLTELPSAMRSCRAWYAAVRSLPLQDASFLVRSTRQLHQLLMSSSTPLARHIVECAVCELCPAADLAQLSAFLPNLQSLFHWSCSLTELHPQLYSSHLRELMVNFVQQSNGAPVPRDDSSDDSDADNHSSDYDYDEPWRELAVQMNSLSSASGLRCLTLTFPDIGFDVESVSLEPIACMKELEEFTLHNCYALHPEDLMSLCRLPSLRKLTLNGWSEQQLIELLDHCSDSPLLRLLHDFNGFDQKDCNLIRAERIVRIPMLQRLEPLFITPDALQLIAHGLANLPTLRLCMAHRWMDRTHVCDWSMVRESLAACLKLTDLTLWETPVEEFAALLLALPPSMRLLTIRHCTHFLDSNAVFQCVAEGGLRQLQQLQIFLDRKKDGEGNSARIVEWLTRQRACAPWIAAVMREV
jgi:hypothetical protein